MELRETRGGPVVDLTATVPPEQAVDGLVKRMTSWETPQLAERYASATPWPHAVIDDPALLPLAQAAYAEALDLPDSSFLHRRSRRMLKRETTPPGPGTSLDTLFQAFDSEAFVSTLSRVTGVPSLSADPTRVYAGVQITPWGGFQQIHEDFPRHPVSRLWHRVNVLFYCSPWEPGYGGELQLWSRGASAPATEVAPLQGRLILFESHSGTLHGLPTPSSYPPDRPRVALSCLYYTPVAPSQRPSPAMRRWSRDSGDGLRPILPTAPELLQYGWHEAGSVASRLRNRRSH